MGGREGPTGVGGTWMQLELLLLLTHLPLFSLLQADFHIGLRGGSGRWVCFRGFPFQPGRNLSIALLFISEGCCGNLNALCRPVPTDQLSCIVDKDSRERRDLSSHTQPPPGAKEAHIGCPKASFSPEKAKQEGAWEKVGWGPGSGSVAQETSQRRPD